MKTIDQVLTDILRREGWPAVTNLSSDRGGLTKGGVTLRSYNAWRAKRQQGPLTRPQFINLTEADAREFFRDGYAKPFEFVGDDPIAPLLIDWCVNAGVDDPTKALQTALQSRYFYPGAIDGVLGPGTRAAWVAWTTRADSAAAFLLERELVIARMEFHLSRAFDADVRAFLASHPATQLHNLRGWLHRTQEFL